MLLDGVSFTLLQSSLSTITPFRAFQLLRLRQSYGLEGAQTTLGPVPLAEQPPLAWVVGRKHLKGDFS